VVAENPEAATAAGADDQILVTIAIVVEPRHARPELRQGVGQQPLALPVVERRVGMNVPRELRRRIFEQRFSARAVVRGARRGRRRDLVQAVGGYAPGGGWRSG